MKLVARTVQGYRRRRLPRNVFGMRRRRVGMRKRRVGCRKRRVRRGGFLGNILRGIHSIARSVPIVSTALRATGNPLAGSVAGALGYGMRKRRVRRGGFMKGFMGAIPLALNRGLGRRRRVRRGGFKRRGTTTFGGFRRKGYVQFGGIRHAPRRPLVSRRIIRRSGMRRRRVRRGRGIMDMLRKAHSFAKENKLISRGLSMIPHKYAKTAGTIASSLGYGMRTMRLGRRRRRVGMRRMRLGRRRRRVGMRRMRLGRYLPNVSRF